MSTYTEVTKAAVDHGIECGALEFVHTRFGNDFYVDSKGDFLYCHHPELRITNKMLVKELKKMRCNPDNCTEMDVNFAWLNIRERNGHTIYMTGTGLSEVPATPLSEERCDKVIHLLMIKSMI